MMTVTRIEHARELKRLAYPTNTPVEDRELSAAYSKLWIAMQNTRAKFMTAMLVEFPKTQSRSKLAQAAGLLEKLRRGCEGAAKFALDDEGERMLLLYFLEQRAEPFVNYWAGVIAALRDGEPVQINSDDCPEWTDDAAAAWKAAP